MPGRAAFEPVTSEQAHASASLGVIEQLAQLICKMGDVIGPCLQGRVAGGETPLCQVERDDGLPSAMYSRILYMVDWSFMSGARSGLTHTKGPRNNNFKKLA
jgi:hypothetical protein